MTQSQLNAKMDTYMLIRLGGSTLGLIGGLAYAFTQKKSFWGYVGYGLLGSIVAGGLTYVATIPMASKIAKEIESAS